MGVVHVPGAVQERLEPMDLYVYVVCVCVREIVYNTLSIYSMSIIRHVSLHVNCGYARVNISRQSQIVGCRARTAIDTDKRAQYFRSQFSACPEFGISAHFIPQHERSQSQFNRDCDNSRRLQIKVAQ